MLLRFLLMTVLVSLSTSATDEQWFAFDLNQFPGFYTPLFTLRSPSSNTTTEQQRLEFSLSSYERSIIVGISTEKVNETNKQSEQLVKLNIERADLLYNTPNHLIFIAVRQRTKLETYVNCKLIDSYLLYSPSMMHEKEDHNETFFTIQTIADGIRNFEMATIDKFGCKPSSATTVLDSNKTSSAIGRPLIRKMQHVIEKVQRRKQRSRRQNAHQPSAGTHTDSLTVVYMPKIDNSKENNTTFHTILNVSNFVFHIRYYPNEHLFNVRLNNENRTQIILYADKTSDLLRTAPTTNNILPTIVLFLHVTPSMISCYVNCELTDQEFLIDSAYVQNMIQQTMEKNNENEEKFDYDRQSTLVIFNKTIEQIAANFFCLKLDKKNEELLPDKYALSKFSNALDMLVNSLDTPVISPGQSHQEPIATSTSRIAAVDFPSINGFGSLMAQTLNEGDTVTLSTTDEIVRIDQSCKIDRDCGLNSHMQCQHNRCTCPSRFFWSTNHHRCILCKDLSIGNRCFHLSNHKSTWFESNEYCQDENTIEDQQDYTMKLASNLNRTDIELIKHSLTHQDDGDHLDYFYWLGATSNFDTRKLHQKQRNKRRVPTTVFRWYDNGETAQLNSADIWCSQANGLGSILTNNNELCVSLTACGLYADDCQRNYRFLCEAI